MKLSDNDIPRLMDVISSTARKTFAENRAYTPEDIAQDVFTELLEYDGEVEDVFALAITMTKRASLDILRKEARRAEIERDHGDEINAGMDGSREYMSADPREVLAYQEMSTRLSELSPKLMETVRGYYLEGKSVASLAESEGVSEDVIYKRLERARTIVTGETDE